MTDVDVTELIELDARKVSGVTAPANGAEFVLIKAAAESEDCPLCKGSGKIRAGKVTCPDCKGSGTLAKSEDTPSDEADAEEAEITGSSAKEAEEWERIDKALSAKDRDKMPTSSFAFVDKKGGKHLPIHDEDHVKSALGRFAQQDFSEAKGDPADAKKKAAGKIKAAAGKHGIELDPKSTVAEAATKGQVQDALDGTKTPEAGGHLDTGKSGMSGSIALGAKGEPPDSAQFLGGESTAEIPLETQTREHPIPASTDGAGIVNPQAIAKAVRVATVVEAMEQIESNRQAIKDGRFLEATGPAAETPGSMPWESYDAATLRQVAECLAGCCSALDNIAERERTEARVADVGDLSNARDLEEAASALEFALGVAARLSYHEAAEGEATKSASGELAKVGRTLSGKNMAALRAAHDHLGAVIDGAKGKDNDDEETIDMASVTKDELGELVVKSVKAVLDQERKDRKAAKKKAAEEEAEKNANNDGDISEGDIKPTKSADAEDVNAVKSTDEDGVLTKQVADQIEELTKSMESVKETVAKFAKRPRPGGPSLDGQARGIPAVEGRQDEVVKSEQDGVIEQLQKSLDEATDPVEKERIGEKLSVERLSQFYAARGLPR